MFLPADGIRVGTGVNYVGTYGVYWSSSPDNERYAYMVYIGGGRFYPQNRECRSYGFSVRLVRDAD